MKYRKALPSLGRTAVYRHFDRHGILLYVGISLSAVERLRGHRLSSRWYDFIANVRIEYHPTRALALQAEKIAIINEYPVFNSVHSRSDPHFISRVVFPLLRAINSQPEGQKEDEFDFDAIAKAAGLDPNKDLEVIGHLFFYRLKRKFLTMLEERDPEFKSVTKE